MTAAAPLRRWWAELAMAAICVAAITWILQPYISAAWYARDAQRELVAFTSELKLDMSQADVRARFASVPREFLVLREVDTTLTLVRTPHRFGASEWLGWLEFADGRLSSVRIRIADSRDIKPNGSPPDVGTPPPDRR